MLQEVLTMTESYILQVTKIKEQRNYCLDTYGESAFSNATPPITKEGKHLNFIPILYYFRILQAT